MSVRCLQAFENRRRLKRRASLTINDPIKRHVVSSTEDTMEKVGLSTEIERHSDEMNLIEEMTRGETKCVIKWYF